VFWVLGKWGGIVKTEAATIVKPPAWGTPRSPAAAESAAGGTSLAAQLRGFLEEADPATGERWGSRLVRALVERALEGDFRAQQLIWSRIDGPLEEKDGRSEPVRLAIDEAMVCRLLEAARDADDDPPAD
jgi:hypothetical protein